MIELLVVLVAFFFYLCSGGKKESRRAPERGFRPAPPNGPPRIPCAGQGPRKPRPTPMEHTEP